MQYFSKKGNTGIYILRGGLSGWEAEGLPIITGAGLLTEPLTDFITARDLLQIQSDGEDMLLIDLRRNEFYMKGHIPDAINIPAHQLEQYLSGAAKDRLIILYDDGSGLAADGTEKLRRNGFKLVRYLFGGMPVWEKEHAAEKNR